jgi:hypothetical protein
MMLLSNNEHYFLVATEVAKKVSLASTRDCHLILQRFLTVIEYQLSRIENTNMAQSINIDVEFTYVTKACPTRLDD